MGFFSFIPAWIACGLLYGSSKRQGLFAKPINKTIALLMSLILLSISVWLISYRFPVTSAMLAGLMLIMTFLPLLTIVSAYGRQKIINLTGVICLSSVFFGYVNGA